MSQKYDDTNRGVLFKNDRKESDKHPDYRGQINVNGEEFWLSAWIKSSEKGKFMSLSVQPKEDKPKASKPAKEQPRSDDTDDIPFANPYRGRLSYVV